MKNQFVTSAILIIILFFSTSPFIKTEITDKEDGFYSTNMATTTVMDEYMPVWVKHKPLNRPEKKVEIIKGKGSIKNINYNTNQISFLADINKSALIQINTIYWPGWSLYVDGNKSSINYNNPRGLIQFTLLPDIHVIQVKFEETPLRLFADTISLFSLLILVYITIKNRARSL